MLGSLLPKHFMTIVISQRIDIEDPVTHVHTGNVLVESLIKRLKKVARTFLMRYKLPSSA